MNIVVFTLINVGLISMKQAASNKQISLHKNTCHKYLVHAFTDARYTYFLKV